MDKWEKQQKFWSAMAFFLMNGLFCKWLNVDGVVYQSVAIVIAGAFLGAQAVVEWKNNKGG